ncbi:putative fatty acyl-CoA reductase CG5065 [Venturia canescens]|uniref:putative fatty acyl-CoA reductase CG5065 n=1 Tax=Venturia canescens TaxID=32260 RepID=UPI001C9CF12E|nr:putative fatty acyl-CoA reductase CG5065 [Venturia canescens]XP_043285676.1 putative fatty acyl-CoA reductase CG5065 [Venturia canescens]XP_043285677.1 putative fatty acyl-CoA reductase CG5065 [Venturia canescens]
MGSKNDDSPIGIPAFYAGRSVLVTGATGFMGKVLIEKLLRSCPDVREIFLLLRPKKNMPIDDRLRKMLSLPLFDKIRDERPGSFEKLIPVIGDVTKESLGLPMVERNVLINRVSIVFHVAASVRFDDSLKAAVFLNTRSTRDICNLATQMTQLVALVHVSTTYSQADKSHVEEKIYTSDVDWKRTIKIAENVDEHVLETLTPKFLGPFPNTYTFTKRLAEQVISDYSAVIPTVVFRPSIVISTLAEPMKGWLDNFNGPVGMMVGGGKGVLRVLYCDAKTKADFIPVDIAIKAMITACWKRGITTITKDPSVHVYNCSSADTKNITLQELINMGLKYNEQIPLEGCLWKPSTIRTNEKIVYYILMLFLHLLPAIFIDGLLKMSGRKPTLVKLQRKVYIANSALKYFLMHEWYFENKGLQNLLTKVLPTDYETFGYDYATFDIYTYFKHCLIGAKTYLLQEDMKNLPQAKQHFRRMWWIDAGFKVWIGSIAVWFFIKALMRTI